MHLSNSNNEIYKIYSITSIPLSRKTAKVLSLAVMLRMHFVKAVVASLCIAGRGAELTCDEKTSRISQNVWTDGPEHTSYISSSYTKVTRLSK